MTPVPYAAEPLTDLAAALRVIRDHVHELEVVVDAAIRAQDARDDAQIEADLLGWRTRF
jgi:hypothetical protein